MEEHAMYGTIGRLHPQGGGADSLRALQAEWNRDRRPKVGGARDAYLFTPDLDPGGRPTLFLIAVFEDEASYRANAASPEQDAWYQRLRAHLVDDPDWMDGHFELA